MTFQFINVGPEPRSWLHPECNYDLKDQLEYLSNSVNLIVLHNNERFEAHLYGDNKIVKESVITQW